MSKRYKTHERYAIVWGLKKERVSATEKFVLLALNEHADDDGGNCSPSTNTLAEETGYTRECVSKVIARLSEKGLISISKRFENGAQKSNNYKLNYGVMVTANLISGGGL
jgi:DNA-binding MarR family transcriptional regulator